MPRWMPHKTVVDQAAESFLHKPVFSAPQVITMINCRSRQKRGGHERRVSTELDWPADLLCYLAPPWIRFGDGTVWIPGADFDRRIPCMKIVPDLGPIPDLRPQYPAALEQIEIRLGAFQRAVLLGS